MFYRLEACWSFFDEYFQRPLCYTKERSIDRFCEHDFAPLRDQVEAICGLWMFRDYHDAVRFWETDPSDSPDSKSRSAADHLNGVRQGFPGRFCVRIEEEAFNGNHIYRDLPRVHLYPSSCFHARAYMPLRDQPSGPLVRHVFVDDQFVSVLYDGKWHRKNLALSRFMKEDILKEGNIDKAKPTSDADNFELFNGTYDTAERESVVKKSFMHKWFSWR